MKIRITNQLTYILVSSILTVPTILGAGETTGKKAGIPAPLYSVAMVQQPSMMPQANETATLNTASCEENTSTVLEYATSPEICRLFPPRNESYKPPCRVFGTVDKKFCPPGSPDPLATLSKDEMDAVVALIAEYKAQPDSELPETAIYSIITLNEPDKELMLKVWLENADLCLDRVANAVMYDCVSQTLYNVYVSLRTKQVLEVVPQLLGSKPMINIAEFDVACNVKNDPRMRAACKARGLSDEQIDEMQCDPWSPGYNWLPIDLTCRRFIRVYVQIGPSSQDNPWANPLADLYAHVDLCTGEVVEVIEGEPRLTPTQKANWQNPPDSLCTQWGITKLRDVKPIVISQPYGRNFKLDGNILTWQNWKMRVRMDPIEGIILNTISYLDDITDPCNPVERPIIYRMGLAGVAINYGGDDFNNNIKTVADATEYGFGLIPKEQVAGCDVMGDPAFIDGTVILSDGLVLPDPTIPVPNLNTLGKNAISISEMDCGVGMSHRNPFTLEPTGTYRDIALVIRLESNVGNYDYVTSYMFHLDGSINVQVAAQGVVQTDVRLADGSSAVGSQPIDTFVAAPNHQHTFCIRIDTCVDGPNNTVIEENTVNYPCGENNSQGNVWILEEAPLTNELDAARLINPYTDRKWKIVNPNKENSITGGHTGYQIEPFNGPTLFSQNPLTLNRFAYATENFWVTAYDPCELLADGKYITQNPGTDGLARYASQGRNIDNTDVVVWCNLSIAHEPHVEEWPQMWKDAASFRIRPDAFFARNPAINLAPCDPKDQCCKVRCKKRESEKFVPCGPTNPCNNDKKCQDEHVKDGKRTGKKNSKISSKRGEG